MRGTWWVLAALAVGACPEKKPAAPTTGLRVPLPDGWVASASVAGVLEVGPKGRVAVTLERRPFAPLPPVEALSSAVTAEGGTVVSAEAGPGSVRVRYSKGQGAGLLVVRPLGEQGLLLCASTPVATEAELEAAEAVCGQARLEVVR